jgi:hypothetical protein
VKPYCIVLADGKEVWHHVYDLSHGSLLHGVWGMFSVLTPARW